jgi:hypothetical protein
VARLCTVVIKYLDFSWLVQQLCSATFPNWRQNTAHDAVSPNFSEFAAPAPVLVLL